MLDGSYYFDCICDSYDHTLRFTLDYDKRADYSTFPRQPEIYAELSLSYHYPWYKRVWVGMKYIFGSYTTSGYGCWSLNEEGAARRLYAMLEDWAEESGVVLNPQRENLKKVLNTKAPWEANGAN
jgi:hypothetical protein